MNNIQAEDLEAIYQGLTEAERERLRGARVVLTGVAGFLGYTWMQFLAAYAEKLGLKAIVGLDNFLLGRPEWLEKLSGVTLETFDVVKDTLHHEADYVVHMASVASPAFYRRYPLETVDANVWGLRKLLDFYRGRNLKGLLFFSSSEIYGDPAPSAIPTPEDYRGNVSVIGPRACYDEAKRFGETLCYLYHQQHGVPVRVVRPFNNYGPGMRLGDQRVPADFAKAVLEGRDIEIFSDGSPTRTFCYVSDAVLGQLKVLLHDDYDFFNIGSDGPEISIARLAEIYVDAGREVCGYTGQARLSPPPEAEYLTHNPNRRCPDISKARRLLGFAPAVPVERGVRRFLESLR